MHREKEFMVSMTEDLEKDTSILKGYAGWLKKQQTGLDSLINIIQYEKFDESVTRILYSLQEKYVKAAPLQLIDRTALQLKNSGGMRLIRNRKVADSIIQYWLTTDGIYTARNSLAVYISKTQELSQTIFNRKYYPDKDDYRDTSLIGNPRLMTKDFDKLTEFANWASMMENVLRTFYIKLIERHSTTADNLSRFIKKEYHLE